MGNWWCRENENGSGAELPPPPDATIVQVGSLYKTWDVTAVQAMAARRVVGRAAGVKRGKGHVALPVLYPPHVVEGAALAGGVLVEAAHRTGKRSHAVAFPAAGEPQKRPRWGEGGTHDGAAEEVAVSHGGLVAAHLLSLGYWLTDGFKYGAQFAAYAAHPNTCHAQFLVMTVAALPAARDVCGWVRLAQSVRKALLLCTVGKGASCAPVGPPPVAADARLRAAVQAALSRQDEHVECMIITYERGLG